MVLLVFRPLGGLLQQLVGNTHSFFPVCSILGAPHFRLLFSWADTLGGLLL
jgi:hypothetical protein